MFNKKSILILVTSLFIILAVGCGQNKAETYPDAIANVNGRDIPFSIFESYLEQTKSYYLQMGHDLTLEEESESLSTISKGLIEDLISEELLRQAAEEEGHEVSDEEIDQEIEYIKSGFESEEEFHSALEQDFYTVEMLKYILRTHMLIDRYLEPKLAEISVSEEEIVELYEFYKEHDDEIPSLDEIRDEIEDDVKYQKSDELVLSIINDLRENAQIEIFDDKI